jgi:hypothetical protein
MTLLESFQELAAKQHAADSQKDQEPMADQGSWYAEGTAIDEREAVRAAVLGEAERRVEGDDVIEIPGNRGIEGYRFCGVEHEGIVRVAVTGLVARVIGTGLSKAEANNVLPLALYNFSAKSLIVTFGLLPLCGCTPSNRMAI